MIETETIYTYCGRDIKHLTKEELIEALIVAFNELNETRKLSMDFDELKRIRYTDKTPSVAVSLYGGFFD